jgi:hypothetical protein
MFFIISKYRVLHRPYTKTIGVGVSIVSDYRPDGRGSIFLLASVSRPDLSPTQPLIQWVPGVKRSLGVMLTTHPHLVPRSRMNRNYSSSPPRHLHGCSRTALILLFTKTLNSLSRVLLETLIVRSDSENIPRLVWNNKVNWCVHKILPVVLS